MEKHPERDDDRPAPTASRPGLVELAQSFPAAPDFVWESMMMPELMPRWLGGFRMVCDWQVGGPFAIKGILNRKSYQELGTLLAYEPGQRLQYEHWSRLWRIPNLPENRGIQTLELIPEGAGSLLKLRHELPEVQALPEHSRFFWRGALYQLLRVVESRRTELLALMCCAWCCLNTAGAFAAPSPQPYTIVLEKVQEVCLLGRADLDYFTRLLAPEGLHPTVREGFAEVMMCAVDSVYGGTRYVEAPLSVFTSEVAGGAERSGAFLLRAYNTSRFFAWVERVRNHAPYYHAKIPRGYHKAQSYLTLMYHGKSVLDARMSGKSEGSLADVSVFEGPLQFPVSLAPRGSKGVQMWAKLEGELIRYPFVAGQDTMEIGAASIDSYAQILRDSHFEPQEWLLREVGRHSVTELMSR